MIEYRIIRSYRWFSNVLLLSLFSISYSAFGQQIQRIEVFTITDGEPVVSAAIYASENRLAVTDENGAFTISCEQTARTLSLRYFGATVELPVPATKRCDKKIRIGVDLTLSLREVTVSNQNSTGTSQATYRIETLTRPPALLGQPDILRGLALRSGISHGQEGNANIFVRGGTPDQNLMLIDDAPVYNVNHLAGFLSVFNDDAIRSVSVYKTTPPLAYGNRLSSVIGVRLKNGSSTEWRGKVGLGIVSANAYIEGPLIRNKTTLIVGIRAGYWDLVNLGINKNTETNYFDLRMTDYTIKLSHTFSERHRLFISSYRSNDVNVVSENASNIFDQGQTVRQFTRLGIDYGNQTFSVRDYFEFSEKLDLVSFAYLTNYRNKYNEIRKTYDPELIREEEEEVNSTLSEFGGATRLGLSTVNVDYSAGIAYSAKTADPLNASVDGQVFPDNPLVSSSTTFTVFAGGDYRISDRLKFMGGARVNAYRNGSYRQVFPEFRTRLSYQLPKSSNFSVSANRTGQDLQIISSGTLGQNTDAYVLANADLPLQSGWQADVGYARQLGSVGHLRIGYYYRRMNNVLFYQNFGQGVEEAATVLRNARTQGRGFSHGLELETELEWRSLEVLLSYTLAQTKHRFPQLNGGQKFPFRYDRPHDLSVNLSYPLGKKYRVGASFLYQSGIAVTTPTARVPASDNYTSFNVVPAINNVRFPSYNRLDISLTRTWRGKRKNKNTLRLSAYNAYNRVNPTFYSSRAFADFAGTGDNVITVQTLRVGQFGFLPSIFYARTFGNYEE